MRGDERHALDVIPCWIGRELGAGEWAVKLGDALVAESLGGGSVALDEVIPVARGGPRLGDDVVWKKRLRHHGFGCAADDDLAAGRTEQNDLGVILAVARDAPSAEIDRARIVLPTDAPGAAARHSNTQRQAMREIAAAFITTVILCRENL